MKKQFTLFDGVNYVLLTLAALFCIFPFWYIFVISVSSPMSYANDRLHFWPKVIQFTEYQQALVTGGIVNSLGVSALITIAGTLLSLLLTIPCAYALSKERVRMKGFLSGLIVFTMLFNGGLIPYYLVVTKLGLTNTLWALILPMAVSAYNLIIAKNFMANLPQDLEESAKIDGANDLKIFVSIILPLSKPLIAVMALFYGVAYYNDYFNAILFISSRDLYPIQLLLREMVINNISMSSNVGSAGEGVLRADIFKMACVMIGLLPILLIYPFLQKYFIQGVMLGAVKE
jgi:putative aldouronate transport system permease protein